MEGLHLSVSPAAVQPHQQQPSQLPTWPLIGQLRQRGCWSSQWRSHTSLCLASYSCCSCPQANKVGRSIGSRPGLCSKAIATMSETQAECIIIHPTQQTLSEEYQLLSSHISTYIFFNCDRPHNSSTSAENLWSVHLSFFVFLTF